LFKSIKTQKQRRRRRRRRRQQQQQQKTQSRIISSKRRWKRTEYATSHNWCKQQRTDMAIHIYYTYTKDCLLLYNFLRNL
jgi:hypothetical protein